MVWKQIWKTRVYITELQIPYIKKKNGQKSLLLPIYYRNHRTIWDTMKWIPLQTGPVKQSTCLSILWSWYTGLILFILELLWQIILDLNLYPVLLDKTELPCTLKERTTLWNRVFPSFALQNIYEDRQVQFLKTKLCCISVIFRKSML